MNKYVGFLFAQRISMKSKIVLVMMISLLGLTSCTDFFNRAYRYNDEIPLKPFVMKLVKTEYGKIDGKWIVKVSLEITNKASDKNTISRNRFTLRAGPSQEVSRERNLIEELGFETVAFGPGETVLLTIPFVLSEDELQQKLALIVDRQTRKGREYLTLIQVKDASAPKKLPEGEWRTARSSAWE